MRIQVIEIVNGNPINYLSLQSLTTDPIWCNNDMSEYAYTKNEVSIYYNPSGCPAYAIYLNSLNTQALSVFNKPITCLRRLLFKYDYLSWTIVCITIVYLFTGRHRVFKKMKVTNILTKVLIKNNSNFMKVLCVHVGFFCINLCNLQSNATQSTIRDLES